MKIVSVIPVHGRGEVVPHTVRRLINKGVHVICVGGEEDKSNCKGSEFIEFSNDCLGTKWNEGFKKAKEHKPDAILVLGSNQWVSDNYIDYMSQFLENNHLVGRRQFNILHFTDSLQMARWMHYPKDKLRLINYLNRTKAERAFIKQGGRYNEPVGMGRLVRSDFLDAVDWMPYTDVHKNLDSVMMGKLSDFEGSYYIDDTQHCQSLKITSSTWNQLNSLDKYFAQGTTKEIITPIEFLIHWFPEALEI